MSGPRVKVPLLLILAVVLHTSVLAHAQVAGVAPDLMLLVAVSGGIAGGPSRGAILGFASGLCIDLFLQTPLGLSALSFSLVGYVVGNAQAGVLRSSWWLPLVAAFLGSVAGEALYAVAGLVVGQTQLVTSRLPLVALLVGVMNTVLAPFAIRAVSWSFRDPHARPVYA